MQFKNKHVLMHC